MLLEKMWLVLVLFGAELLISFFRSVCCHGVWWLSSDTKIAKRNEKNCQKEKKDVQATASYWCSCSCICLRNKQKLTVEPLKEENNEN